MFCTDLEQLGFIQTGDSSFPYRATAPNLICESDEPHTSSTVVAHWHTDELLPFFYCQKHEKLNPNTVLTRAADGKYTSFVRHWPSFSQLYNYPMWMWAGIGRSYKGGLAITTERPDGVVGEAAYIHSHAANSCQPVDPDTKPEELPIKGGAEKHVSTKRDAGLHLKVRDRYVMPLVTRSGLPEGWSRANSATKTLPGLVFTYTNIQLVCLDFDGKDLPLPVEAYITDDSEPELHAVLDALARHKVMIERSVSGLGVHAYFLASDIDIWRAMKFTLTPEGCKWHIDLFRGGRAGWVAVTEDWLNGSQDLIEEPLPMLSSDLLEQFRFLANDISKAKARGVRPDKPWRPRPSELHSILEDEAFHLFIEESADLPYIDTENEDFAEIFGTPPLIENNALHRAGLDLDGPRVLTEHHCAWLYRQLVKDSNVSLPQNYVKPFRDAAALNAPRNLTVDYMYKCFKEYDATTPFNYWVLPELYHLPLGSDRHAEVWRTAVRGFAARIIAPGCYVGTVVCLAGDIGLNKSALFQLMMPPAEAPLAKKLPKEVFQKGAFDKLKKAGEAYSGASLIEIEEINTLFTGMYDQGEFMDQLLSTTARYRKSYRPDPQDYPMTAAFVGSLNLAREHEPFIPTNTPGYLRRLYIIFIEGQRPKLPIMEFKDWWITNRERFWGAVMHDIIVEGKPYYPVSELEKSQIIPETRLYTDVIGAPAMEFLYERHMTGEIENFQRRELYDLYSETGDGRNSRIGVARFGQTLVDLGYEIKNKRLPRIDNPSDMEQRRVYVFQGPTEKLRELDALYQIKTEGPGETPSDVLSPSELEALAEPPELKDC